MTDFREEVLGLQRTQMVKNVLIVPVAARRSSRAATSSALPPVATSPPLPNTGPIGVSDSRRSTWTSAASATSAAPSIPAASA